MVRGSKYDGVMYGLHCQRSHGQSPNANAKFLPFFSEAFSLSSRNLDFSSSLTSAGWLSSFQGRASICEVVASSGGFRNKETWSFVFFFNYLLEHWDHIYSVEHINCVRGWSQCHSKRSHAKSISHTVCMFNRVDIRCIILIHIPIPGLIHQGCKRWKLTERKIILWGYQCAYLVCWEENSFRKLSYPTESKCRNPILTCECCKYLPTYNSLVFHFHFLRLIPCSIFDHCSLCSGWIFFVLAVHASTSPENEFRTS